MHRRLLLSVILMAAALPLRAQFFVFGSDQGEAPVMLTGGYRMLGQTSNRQGTFSERPADLWRFELNPTVSFYGVPLTANILLSSEQAGIRQDINAFSLTLDPEALQRIVLSRAYRALSDVYNSEDGALLRDLDGIRDSLSAVDPERLKQLEAYKTIQQARELGNADLSMAGDALRELGLMSDVESFMTQMPTIGVGTVYPTFSPLTVSGVRLQGGFIEWNPGGLIYLQGAYGTTQRPLTRLDTVRVDSNLYTNFDQSAYGRQLVAGKFGFGRRDGPHVFVTAMSMTDDAASVSIIDSNTVLTPQKNLIGGLDFKVEPIRGIWTLEAEGAVSLTVGDQRAPTFTNSSVPSFLLDLVDSSLSAFADWSATASTQVSIRSTGTRLSGSIRRIGAGYRTFGVPNIRTDVLRYDARADQSFWRRQLSVGVFYRRDQDNLVPWKRSTTTITSLGGSVGLNVRNYPYLRVTYAPYAQVNDDSNPLYRFDNRTTMITGATGYSYRIGEYTASTNVNVGRQFSETIDNLYDYAVTSVNLSQSLAFVDPLSLTVGVGYIQQVATLAPDNTIWTADASGSYTAFEVATFSLGLTAAFESERSTRTGFFVALNAPIENYAVVDIRAERTLFDERIQPAILGGSYNETILRATISKYW